MTENTIKTQNQKPKKRLPKLQNEERLKRFGLFKLRPDYFYDGETNEVKTFVEDFIRKIDEKFTRDEIIVLNYDLSALLSVINDPDNEISRNQYKHMPNKILAIYNFLSRKVLVSSKDRFGDINIFDHIYWYYDNENPTTDLIIESHPYAGLSNPIFTIFSNAIQKYPEHLEIVILPNSHYFANHTLYIKIKIKDYPTFSKIAKEELGDSFYY